MRTTITIEDEVVSGIKELQRKFPKKSFNEIVNETLKRGLSLTAEIPQKEFSINPLDAEHKKNLDFDNIGRLLEIIDGAEHK